jgi:hypothetical protein
MANIGPTLASLSRSGTGILVGAAQLPGRATRAGDRKHELTGMPCFQAATVMRAEHSSMAARCDLTAVTLATRFEKNAHHYLSLVQLASSHALDP